MRIMSGSVPELGHVLPLLPMMTAAEQEGHEVALLTSQLMAPALPGIRLLPAGPMPDVLFAEVGRRMNGLNPKTDAQASGIAEFCAGVRVGLGFEQALESARAFAPDLVIAGQFDCVGPLVAAALMVPYAVHTVGPAVPERILETISAVAEGQYVSRGYLPADRVALLDLCPVFLQDRSWRTPGDWIAVRPEPHSRRSATWTPRTWVGRENLPLVVVSLGTSITDPATLLAVVIEAAQADVNIVATGGLDADPSAMAGIDSTRVQLVDFVPLAELLQGASVIVCAGGSGTVLAALSKGIPMVILPMVADQPINAARAASIGAALVVGGPEDVGGAVRQVLTDTSYADAAIDAATRIAAMPTAHTALGQLLDRAFPQPTE